MNTTTHTSMIRGLPPVHPGELLREDILPAAGVPKTRISEMLGLSRQTLYDILAEKQAVTAAVALRLGRLFGNSPEFWLRMQNTYDLKRAEQEIGAQLDAIPHLEASA